MFPASILEKSRISSTIQSRAWPESRSACANSYWRGSRSASNRSSVMPMTPFMGVLISWLMLARKLRLQPGHPLSPCPATTAIAVCASASAVTSATVPTQPTRNSISSLECSFDVTWTIHDGETLGFANPPDSSSPSRLSNPCGSSQRCDRDRKLILGDLRPEPAEHPSRANPVISNKRGFV